jgi:predicted 2-oxoglutarate/Fe(II)-dependent dioxygenase YbiX
MNANRGYDTKFKPMFERFTHLPATGDYLIFPSFAYHHVNPYTSALRFCLPVDLFVDDN